VNILGACPKYAAVSLSQRLSQRNTVAHCAQHAVCCVHGGRRQSSRVLQICGTWDTTLCHENKVFVCAAADVLKGVTSQATLMSVSMTGMCARLAAAADGAMHVAMVGSRHRVRIAVLCLAAAADSVTHPVTAASLLIA
jgi:hypothetical protein